MTPRLKRWLRRAAAGAGALIAVGGVTIYLSLNHIVKQAVERQSTRSMNLATTVDAATLAVLGGELHLENFRIASPDGFSGEPLLVVPAADMGMTYSRLRDDPVYIPSVTFVRPRLLVEVAGGKINLKRMTEQLPPRPPHPLRLVIGEVRVVDATVILRPGVPGWPAELTVPVATFTLRDLGGGAATPGGVTVREVVTELIRALAAHAADSAVLPPELRALLKGDVGAVLSQLGAEAQRRLAGAVPVEAKRVFGGLFGGKAATTRPATVPAGELRQP